MKFGIIGAGGIVHFFLQLTKEMNDDELELTSICSIPKDEEKLVDLCNTYGIGTYYTDLDQMLDECDLDVVYIGVPNQFHYSYTKKALMAGKNVICEKPFTSNYFEAKELAELALEKKLYVFEAVTTRYFPNTQKIKETLKDLGDIKLVTMNYSQYSSRYDSFKSGTDIPAFSSKASGGALMDLNIYNINFIVYLFGKPIDVKYYPNMERGIDTSGILYLDYGSFKCVCVAAKDSKAPISSTIQGDQGCICLETSVNVLNKYRVLLNSKSKKNRFSIEDTEEYNFNESENMMYHEFKQYLSIIKNGYYDKMKEMLDISLITMEIQTKARKDAGIVFDADLSKD